TMMITPKFRVEQDYNNLYVIIRMANCRSLWSENSLEIFHQNNEFIFFGKPSYYLRLELPGEVISKNNEDEEEEEFDWTIEQKISNNDQDDIQFSHQYPYGFANSMTNIIINDDDEDSEIFDIKNPGKKSLAQRRRERLRKELNDFDEQYYLANLYDNDDKLLIDSMIESPSAPWNDWKLSKSKILTDQERKYINENIIPEKYDFIRYDSSRKKTILLSLFDILFGYCYDLRTNDFEHTCESSWTIVKLSPTLSCFEYWLPLNNDYQFDDDDNSMLLNEKNMPKLMLINCLRRSLIYPLYRNWKLSIKVLMDVIDILSIGTNAILKCLLDMHKIMAIDGENRSLINDLYLTHYCCWIQQQQQKQKQLDHWFKSLANYLSTICNNNKYIDKQTLGLDLLVLEKAAKIAIDEQQQQQQHLSKGLKYLLQISDHRVSIDDDSDDD
ncbi:Hsp90 cochaperone shq1, partial [Dermatophagoides pteronyssinus]